MEQNLVHEKVIKGEKETLRSSLKNVSSSHTYMPISYREKCKCFFGLMAVDGEWWHGWRFEEILSFYDKCTKCKNDFIK